MPEIPPYPTLDNIEWTHDELAEIGQRFLDAVRGLTASATDDKCDQPFQQVARVTFINAELQRENERLCAEVDRLRSEVDLYLQTISQRDGRIDQHRYMLALAATMATNVINTEPANALGIARIFKSEYDREFADG